jgi:hypothetical protein
MKRLPLLAMMLAVSAIARAQESEPLPPPPPPHEPFTQGTFTVDAMTTPGQPHIGFGFYLSDRISIRPMFGLGHSRTNGVVYAAAADLRIETRPTNTWSFYGVATGSYRSGRESFSSQQQGGQYGAGVGVRRRFHDRLIVVLDARYLRSGAASLSTTELPSSFGQIRLDNRNQVVASLGLSFALN